MSDPPPEPSEMVENTSKMIKSQEKTDRQTDRQAQTDRETDAQMHGHTDTRTDRKKTETSVCLLVCSPSVGVGR